MMPQVPEVRPNDVLDIQRCLRLHSEMARLRAFEEAAIDALKAKLIFGPLHPYIGQEAIAVGVCANLDREDLLLSTHRGHGHTLAKGADEVAMMCELFGRASGTCGGKGGSMHIADFSCGMLGANGVVSANINIAAGAAHAIRLSGGRRVVSCFFGDGAINRGPFLEGLNWAAVFALPVLFVCEDNTFSATTRTRAMTAGPGAAARAASFGIESIEVDGNDVVAVDEAAAILVAAIRSGGGPRMLVARTYRLTGHTATDAAAYRPADEVAARWQDDPLPRLEALLAAHGVPADTLTEQRATARRQMDEARRQAEASPWPDEALAFADVQDIGDPRVGAF